MKNNKTLASSLSTPSGARGAVDFSSLVTLLGRGRVLLSKGERFPYTYDAALDKRWPGAVALPESAEQVARVVRWAWEHRVPYVVRGAGTSLCGAIIAPTDGLVIHISRLNRILSVDVARRRAWVEPGVVNLHLQKAIAPYGLFYAPDPASQKACTLGGNVGTNAGGPHCLKYGVTSHHITGLEWICANGGRTLLSVDNPGFDWTGLMVGSEGTLGVATKIEVNLIPIPEDIRTFLVAFPTMEHAAQTVTDIISAGIVPATLEVMDRLTLRAVEAFVRAGYPTNAEAVLLIELDGPRELNGVQGEQIRRWCEKNRGTDFRSAADERERDQLWEGRRGAYAAMARLAPNVLVEDGVVPRTRLPEALRRIRAIADRDGIEMGLIAHAGDGNLHPNMIFDERDRQQTARVIAAGQEMLRLCVDMGGSISGEHGIGADKREAMKWLFGPATLGIFRGIKNVFDPDQLCNPDKLIPVVECATPLVSARPKAVGRIPIGSVGEIQDVIRSAVRDRQKLAIRGRETRRPSTSTVPTLVLAGLDKIVDLDRANLTLTVQSGTDLASLRDLLAKEGLHLYLPGSGSVGGVLSTHRVGSDPCRKELLGLKSVSGEGELLSFGAKVMKNVAGYDVARLYWGAEGRLGPVVEVTFKLHVRPHPEGLNPGSVPSAVQAGEFPWEEKLRRVFDPLNVFDQQ